MNWNGYTPLQRAHAWVSGALSQMKKTYKWKESGGRQWEQKIVNGLMGSGWTAIQASEAAAGGRACDGKFTMLYQYGGNARKGAIRMIKNVTKGILCLWICLSANSAFAQDTYRMHLSEDTLYIEQNDKELQNTNLQAYKMGGKNYYKLRDFAMLMESAVEFDRHSNTVSVVTGANKDPLKGHTLEAKDLEVEMIRSEQKLKVDGVFKEYEMYAMAESNYISFSDLVLIYDLNYRWSDEERRIVVQEDSLDAGMPEDPESMFGYINENLEIDCAAGEVDALTQYLDENLEGFEKEFCRVERIHEYTEDGDYLITYTLFHNGIPTPYQVLVFVDPSGGIKYANKLNGYQDAVASMDHSKRIDLTQEELQRIASKNIEGYENFTIKSQKAEVRYDLHMIPYVFIQTTFQTENEALSVKNLEYYL